jgi:uncharacterized protein (UPF0335 family)
MSMNSIAGEKLRAYVERIEAVRAKKRELAEDEKLIKQEAKAEGFDPKVIAACIKIRTMKPHDRQEAEAVLDIYLHALGMAIEPPLFRAAGIGAIDPAVREQVLERMSDFVPAAGLGDIVVTMGSVRVRLIRDKDGVVHTYPVNDQQPPDPPAPASRPRRDEGAEPREAKTSRDDTVPDVDPAGAEQLGREYARANRPVIDNPFPFGDGRRPWFDAGWRKETGSDGMGPDEGE